MPSLALAVALTSGKHVPVSRWWFGELEKKKLLEKDERKVSLFV